MNLVYRNLNDLIMYENNPRKNDDAVEKVAKSIELYGFKVPMVIDKNNVIVCGHTRYKALQQLGWSDNVPCVLADDLTNEQIKQFRIVDNKTAEESTWDYNLLEQELSNIDMSAFDFDFPDLIDEDGIRDLFEDAPKKEKEPKRIQCPHCGEWIDIE